MAKNNRRLGVLVEHEIIRTFAEYFGLISYKAPKWQIASTRAVSKVRDDEGVDIVFRNCKLRNLAVQVKRTVVNSETTSRIDIEPLIRILDEEEPVLITRLFKKHGKVNRNKGDFATIPFSHYLKLLDAYHSSKQH